RQFVEFSTAAYAPLAYLPAAAAIAGGRVFDATPLTLLYLARWADILAASALLAVAIRYGGYAAPGLCVVALFPMSVSQIAIVSGDALTFAIAFLWIAVVMKAAVERPEWLRVRQIWLLPAIALAVSQLRPPFPLLGLLGLAIPLHPSDTSRRALLTASAVIAASILPAVAWNAHAVHLQTKPIIPEHVAPAEQLRYTIENPGEFLEALQRDLARRGYEYWRQAVGRLGWMNIWLPEWIPAGFVCVLGCALFFGAPGASQPRPAQRCLLGLITMAGIVGVELMIYLTFNGVGSRFIRGVQGRYFIPVVALLVFALSNQLFAWSRLRLPILAGCAAFTVAAHVGALIALSRAAAGE
ncbi:MAG TPA: DUF2142 domain-containing protein, partial [Chthoniobacterales bacterium]|nr:DUF2142 domain-containing protein [Chthoniobacterales bacterium]